MPPAIPQDFDRLLELARAGDRDAFDRVYSIVYGELRKLAHHKLRAQSGGLTLNTTALVHEVYVRLAGAGGRSGADHHHFVALAARAMRFVIVDHLRHRNAERRGGGEETVQLTGAELLNVGSSGDDVLAVDRALARLEAVDPGLSRLVELRYFAGLTDAELAATLGVSDRTVRRDWRRARAFLLHALGGEEPH